MQRFFDVKNDANFEVGRVLLCLYLVNIEVTIVSTSLVKITNDLHGFDETSWIVSGYLVTYTGRPGLLNTK